MEAGLLERARAGLQAWQDGDLSALEGAARPGRRACWWEPGDWDCHSRAEVLRLLRSRREEGLPRGTIELIDTGPDALVSVFEAAS